MPTADLAPYLPDDAWFPFHPRGIHGARHTTRVLLWADAFADALAGPGALRREELRWAASLHDVGRRDDGIDRGHGTRSVAWVLETLPALRPRTAGLDLAFVAELCRWHEVPDRDVGHLTLELVVLKDADALDRCRLGDLDPDRLRLARSHHLIEPAALLERMTNRYGTLSAADVLRTAARLQQAEPSMNGGTRPTT